MLVMLRLQVLGSEIGEASGRLWRASAAVRYARRRSDVGSGSRIRVGSEPSMSRNRDFRVDIESELKPRSESDSDQTALNVGVEIQASDRTSGGEIADGKASERE